MEPHEIARRRLGAQQITRHDFATPKELVRWLGAMQAQDYAGVKWAVGLRLPGAATDVAIEQALGEGALLRIHAMRWTWQLVAPEDARWLLGLVGPRVMKRAAKRHRDLGLDAPTIRRSNAAIAKALRGGAELTRAELADVLAGARIDPTGQRLPHLLGCAELEQVACSGRRRGKQHTWALFDERVPAAKSKDARAAAAELALRFVRSRGPVTASDFAWWSGLPAAEARAAIEANDGAIASETIAKRTLWHVEAERPLPVCAGATLLPAFDELLVGYRDRDDVLAPSVAARINAGGGMLAPSVLAGARVVGTWRREIVGGRAQVEYELFARASRRDVIRATRRWAAFVGLSAIA